MAPERYHSNVLEPVTPPRTLGVRLRRGRPAPRSLTGRVVREVARGLAISAPIASRFGGDCGASRGIGAGGPGLRVVPQRRRCRRATRRGWREVELGKAPSPRVAAFGALSYAGVWRGLRPPRVARVPPERGAQNATTWAGAVGCNKLPKLFMLFCKVRVNLIPVGCDSATGVLGTTGPTARGRRGISTTPPLPHEPGFPEDGASRRFSCAVDERRRSGRSWCRSKSAGWD